MLPCGRPLSTGAAVLLVLVARHLVTPVVGGALEDAVADGLYPCSSTDDCQFPGCNDQPGNYWHPIGMPDCGAVESAHGSCPLANCYDRDDCEEQAKYDGCPLGAVLICRYLWWGEGSIPGENTACPPPAGWDGIISVQTREAWEASQPGSTFAVGTVGTVEPGDDAQAAASPGSSHPACSPSKRLEGLSAFRVEH